MEAASTQFPTAHESPHSGSMPYAPAVQLEHWSAPPSDLRHCTLSVQVATAVHTVSQPAPCHSVLLHAPHWRLPPVA
jgi:hypothetical protein